MLKRIMEQVSVTRSWAWNPGFCLDALLDQLDRLNAFVLPTRADRPAYRYVDVKARRRHFGA
jgi:hypothetical protein